MKYTNCNAYTLIGGPQDGETLFFTSDVPPMALTYAPINVSQDGSDSFHQYDLSSEGSGFAYSGVVTYAEDVDYE